MVNRNKLHYENRIALLKQKDPVANAKIIAKARRKILRMAQKEM